MSTKRVKQHVNSDLGSRSRGKRTRMPNLREWEHKSERYMYFSGDGGVTYKNQAWKAEDEVVNDFIQRSRNLSPYDATLRPAAACFHLGGGVGPRSITDDNRSIIIDHSKFALDYYNQQNNQGPTFVFHQLVKCATGIALAQGDMYYITFQAKAEEEGPSNSPAIKTFQAQVWKLWDPAKPPRVFDCAIED